MSKLRVFFADVPTYSLQQSVSILHVESPV